MLLQFVCVWMWGCARLTSIACPGVHRQLPGDLGEDLPLHLGPLLVLVALLVSIGHVELQEQPPGLPRGTESNSDTAELRNLSPPPPEVNAGENVVVTKTNRGRECWRGRTLRDTAIRNEKVKLRLIKQLTTIAPIAALGEYHYSLL